MKDRLIRHLYRLLILSFYKLFLSVELRGEANLPDPKSGPLILAANHFAIFDVPILGYWLPIFPTFFASIELWENRLLSPGLNAMSNDLIKLKRGIVDRQALAAALSHLADGGWLVIFPEGGITPESIALATAGRSTADVPTGLVRQDPVLLPGRLGAARLAIATRASLVPIGISGTDQILENLHRFRRTPVIVTIGKPIMPEIPPDGFDRRAKKKIASALTDRLMAEIGALLAPQRNGPS